MDDGDVAQGLGCERRGRCHGLRHARRVFVGEDAADKSRDDETGQHEEQHSSQPRLPREGNNKRRDEEADGRNKYTGLLRGASLNRCDIPVQPARDLSSVCIHVKVAGRLPQQRLQIRLAQPLGQPLADDAPCKDVDVDGDKGGDGNVHHEQDALVDGGHVVQGVLVGVAGGRARGRVELVDELTKDNGHDGERRAGDGGDDDADGDEGDVDPGGLGGEEELAEDDELMEGLEAVQSRAAATGLDWGLVYRVCLLGLLVCRCRSFLRAKSRLLIRPGALLHFDDGSVAWRDSRRLDALLLNPSHGCASISSPRYHER